MPSQHRRNRLLGAILFAILLGVAFARPVVRFPVHADEIDLVARQGTTGTIVATPSSAPGLASNAPTGASRTQTVAVTRSTTAVAATFTPVTSRVSTTTAATATSSSRTSPTLTSNASTSRATSSTAVTTPRSSTSTTSASAAATNTPQSRSIFSPESPYRSYAIAVTVVVAIFSFLLLVLVIRFIVQCFKGDPHPEPVMTSSGPSVWRYYSRDSETTRDTRHKEVLESDLGERRAFLSTDSVTLYPASQPEDGPTRYTDEEPDYPNRVRSFSASPAPAPAPERRPSATHPAFVVQAPSESGHSDEAQPNNLRAVPEEPAAVPNTTSNLLLTRASHSDLYRQQTLNSVRTDLSRAASTASAYSQQSVYSSVPPVPALPTQYTRPSRTQLSPDVSAALSLMQRPRNGSIDSLNTFKTTAPPTEEGTATPSAIPRERRGRAAWGDRAPSSIHGPDLYFGNL
ncbi:hypothetical protein FRC07_004120 [Ceratobasidium sp. 392]|nr:hypothetical protein FRC07_004120 [Ceratobasidium sp. 392]